LLLRSQQVFDECAVFALFTSLFNAICEGGESFANFMTFASTKLFKSVRNGLDKVVEQFGASLEEIVG
jgi:hypothetical protein